MARASEVRDELADAHAACEAVIDDGIVQTSGGDPASVRSAGSCDAGEGGGLVDRGNFLRHLTRGGGREPGGRDARALLDRDLFSVLQRELQRSLRQNGGWNRQNQNEAAHYCTS